MLHEARPFSVRIAPPITTDAARREGVLMHHRLRALCVITILAAATAPAQQPGTAAAPRSPSTAPRESEQFAFLVGQWEVTVTPKINSLAARIHGSPKYLGTWKAWRAFDRFGIEDELRIMDRSGNPYSLTHTLRFYDATQARWSLTSLDVYRSGFSNAVAELRGSELMVTSAGRDAEGKAYLQRARFFDITPTSFRYQADRSFDSQRTWETGVLRMEARRIAATAAR